MADIQLINDHQRLEMLLDRREQVKFIRDNYLNQVEKQELKEKAKLEKLAKK
jgi:hypothetical protein